MSYADALARVSTLQAMIASPAARTAAPGRFAATLGAAAPASPTASPAQAVTAAELAALFPSAAAVPTTIGTTAGVTTAAGGSVGGAGALAAAESQLGVTEQPPGSNDGPQIARYRSAVAGAYAGAPWCAYFVSWCASQAGAPIGDHGEGLGAVSQIADWARRTGRLTGEPAPGELILFGSRHVGIVESVNPDGTLTTVEGNTTDGVHRRRHAASDATGFVRL